MKYIIITGASSGLGYEIAKLLDKEGKNLVLVGRDKEKLENLKNQLKGNVIIEVGNIGKDSLEAFKNKEIEALFNVAGYGAFGKVEEMKNEEILNMINSNLLGLINFTKSYVEYIKANNIKGKTVSILSTAALMGKEEESVYCATKWGARGFIEALKIELKGRMEFITVFPGGIATPFWENTNVSTEKFMKTHDVAKQIVNAYLDEGLNVEELVLTKKV